MDLTKAPPRSVRETMLGIVQLARTIDKAKAVVQGRFGEYRYDCPMDRGLFNFLGMDSQGVPQYRQDRERQFWNRSLRESLCCQEGRRIDRDP